jgi:hypothetical protein
MALEDFRAELVPAPVADAENAALLYKKAFDLYPEGLGDEETDLVLRVSDGYALTTEERAKLQSVLDRNREVLQLLHEAADRPRCNFNLDYARGVTMRLDHINALIRTSRLLDLEALLSAGPRVFETARATSRLADAVTDEPLIVSQLVRGVCHEIAGQARQREFEGEMSVERLQSLISSLSPARARAGFEKTIYYDFYSIVAGVMEGVDLKGISEGRGPLPPGSPGTPRLDDPLTMQDLASYAETLTQYAALAVRPYYEVRDELARLEASRVNGAPGFMAIMLMAMPAIQRNCVHLARTEAVLGTAQVAAALRLYRDTQGTYPATLDELQRVLPAAPFDPFTGKPFLYRREGSGFVVYSAGAEGTNSGGVSADHDVLFRSPR